MPPRDRKCPQGSRPGSLLGLLGGPSLRQREPLLRLAREYGGKFLLVTVDMDKQKEIASEYGVKSLPSCKLFRLPRRALAAVLELLDPADERIRRYRQALFGH